MQTWEMCDDHRCPECLGPVEVEVRDDDNEFDDRRYRCIVCKHTWREDDELFSTLLRGNNQKT